MFFIVLVKVGVSAGQPKRENKKIKLDPYSIYTKKKMVYVDLNVKGKILVNIFITLEYEIPF